MKQSDSFQIQGEYVTSVDPTMDEERERRAWKNPPREIAHLCQGSFPPFWDCCCPKVEHFSLQVQMNEIQPQSRKRRIFLLVI